MHTAVVAMSDVNTLTNHAVMKGLLEEVAYSRPQKRNSQLADVPEPVPPQCLDPLEQPVTRCQETRGQENYRPLTEEICR
ncbi:hypothetical protein J6590_001608 [Homalodisca vitripennis]|nr:hypothetical protein J6590_001608 [Homalodisca vitripennis]